jgi:prepilin-type N-terminal cleavage/methylation domain-containing protein
VNAPTSNPARRLRRGFTLVELIAASVIVAMIGGATTLVIFRMGRTQRAAANQEAYSRADFAAELMARDVLTVNRDPNLTFARLAVRYGGQSQPEAARDELTLLSVTGRRVRPNPSHNEGPVHEVQYRVGTGSGPAVLGVSGVAESPTALLRREDPNPDEYLDAGGVVTPVVPGVVAVRIQAFDGTSWFDDWDTDTDGYPHAVRVTVTARSDDGRVTRVSRRTIAVDRVPLPVTPPSPEATE